MLNPKTKIDWEMLSDLPLDTKLARKAAPRISEHHALNQIATALHESIHIFYAVKHGSPIFHVEIGTKTKNLWGVKGSINDQLDYGTIGSIESYLAAGIFELVLDPNKENGIAKSEEFNAVKSIQTLRENSENKLSWNFCSDYSFICDKLDKIYPHELVRNWPIIKMIAKVLLFYREKNGHLPVRMTGQLSTYVRDFLPNMPSERDSRNEHDFYDTIARISPAVQKQNLIERKQKDKWMRENDLDTILENFRRRNESVHG